MLVECHMFAEFRNAKATTFNFAGNDVKLTQR